MYNKYVPFITEQFFFPSLLSSHDHSKIALEDIKWTCGDGPVT